MKLLELIPQLKNYALIKRKSWDFFLVKSEYDNRPLVKCDFYMLQLELYSLSYVDLIANDWEIVE
jgi:hypothetical protein